MKETDLALTGRGKKENRRELDFYPTPPECTVALMEFLFMLKGMTIWEPACGDGSMSKVLQKYSDNVISTDIRATGFGKGYVDFLTTKVKCDAIITNPPFNLSEQFIRHGLNNCGIVAVLLKSQYWHAKSRYKLFTDNPPSWVLPLTWRPDFLFDKRVKGGSVAKPTMEVAWSVWINSKKGDTTQYHPLFKPAKESLLLF